MIIVLGNHVNSGVRRHILSHVHGTLFQHAFHLRWFGKL